MFEGDVRGRYKVDQSESIRAPRRDSKSPANSGHLLVPEAADELHQLSPLNSLDMIEVDHRGRFEAFVDSHQHFARCAPDSGRNRSHHHGGQKRDDFLAREDEDGSALVWRFEGEQPDLSPVYSGGHEPWSSQPSNSVPRPATPA